DQAGRRIDQLGQQLSAPPGEEGMTGEQVLHVAFIKPELAEAFQRTSSRERASQAHAVDAARRRAGDNVYDYRDGLTSVGEGLEGREIGSFAVIVPRVSGRGALAEILIWI